MSLGRNTAYLTLASVAQKVLSFFYFLVVARVMGSEDTGGYFLALSLITLSQVVADAGLSSVVTRSVASEKEHAIDTVRRAIGVKVPALFLACVAAIVASHVLGYDAQTRLLVLLALPILLADSISILCYATLRGLHTLAYESIGLFLGQFTTLVVGGIALAMFPDTRVLILALLCGSVTNFLLSIHQISKRLGWGAFKPDFRAASFKTTLRESAPFLLAAVFVKLYSSLDVQFLYHYLGQAAVGVYGVAYKFTYAFQFIPLAFSAALFPQLSKLIGEDKRGEAALILERAFRYMLIIGTPLAFGLAAVAGPAILLAGEEYAAGAAVLAILPLALIPSFLDIPVGSVLNAGHRQGVKTALFGLTLVVNLILNAVLVPRFGMMGAAYASIVSLYVLFLSGFSFVPKILPTFRPSRLWHIALPALVSGGVMYVTVRALIAAVDFSPSQELLLAVPVGGIVFAVSIFLTRGVRAHEIRNLMSTLRRKPSYAPPAPDA